MSSILYRSNKGWSRFGSALLLSIVMNNTYATDESANDIPTTATPTNTAIESNPDRFSLKGNTTSRLMVLKKSHDNAPNNPTIAARLAAEYIQLARTQVDEQYYRLANKVIKPWARQATIPGLPKQSPPIEIRLVRATLSQHDHHYADASEDLLVLIKQKPRHVQAWLTLSTIQLVQGDYKKAQVSCSALARIGSNWLASLCYSQLYSVTGSAKRAYKMQQHLLSQLHEQQSALRLWVTGLLAETALRLGEHDQAEHYFKAGVQIKPNDTYILRSYSDYLLHQHRPNDVIKLLKNPPENDQLLLRFAIATKELGQHPLEKKLVKTLEQRFATTLAKNNHLHGRDEALFLLAFKADDKPSKQRALKLAETNWKTQKEPDDTLTLLRAIIANKDSSKQHIITDWVKKHAVQDQRLASLLSLK
jgi:tetratricopeptide (TPR) repeat protein